MNNIQRASPWQSQLEPLEKKRQDEGSFRVILSVMLPSVLLRVVVFYKKINTFFFKKSQ